MASYEMLRHVAFVRTDFLEERIFSIVMVTRIDELGLFPRSLLRLLITDNFVSSSSIYVTLMMEPILSSEKSFLTKAALRHITKGGSLHSLPSESFKFYIS
jgi:hypothetical protein